MQHSCCQQESQCRLRYGNEKSVLPQPLWDTGEMKHRTSPPLSYIVAAAESKRGREIVDKKKPLRKVGNSGEEVSIVVQLCKIRPRGGDIAVDLLLQLLGAGEFDLAAQVAEKLQPQLLSV